MEICKSLLNAERTSAPVGSRCQQGVLEVDFSEIPLAIHWAKECFGSGGNGKPLSISIEDLQKVKDALLSLRDDLYSCAKEESGRTRADFDLELKTLLRYLEAFQVAHPELQGCVPRGVSVWIGSSVWPIHYGTQALLANLFAGNALILKPSEKVTRIVLKWIQALRELGGPFQTVQVIVGEKETGRRLVCHEDVDLVMVQGTYETGMRVRQDTLSSPGKEVLLFLGAKNPVILNREPDLDLCKKILENAFVCAGQHCMSTPLLFVRSDHLEQTRMMILRAHHEMVASDDAGEFWFGPFQDQARLERYLKFIHVLEKEGGRLEKRGNRDRERLDSCFASATVAIFPALDQTQIRKMESFQVEVLGPHLSIVPFENISDLEALLGGLSYGMASSYFGDPSEIQGILSRNPLGTIALNHGSFELNPWRAPIARKRSGNHGRFGQQLLDQVCLERVQK